MPEDQRETLLDVCKTRWLQRVDGLERVEELMSAILETLDMIANNHDRSYTNKDGRADARGLYWTFRSFSFMIHLIIVRNVLSYTLSLTYELQKKQLDVGKVYEAVDNVIDSLQECRDKVDDLHKEWYETAVEFALLHGTQPSIKRIAGQQTLRANFATDSTSEYYKFSLTIPLLDQVLSELRSRFSPENRIHLNGNYIRPNIVISSTDWKEKIYQFATQYEKDLPEKVNLKAELRQWEIYWRKISTKGNLLDTIVDTLSAVDSIKNWFPNIYVILCLVAVVPATSNSWTESKKTSDHSTDCVDTRQLVNKISFVINPDK
ncbi:52 kDa repressor of the inhibitor of the protein kinase-like [Clytia hemisphaerica]|uniref:52 kDa repressor of the inhibitor of the protein kinase-like n=1 Tax=Clytia hemisphaerica TaxID=252671 RepID=UPI0034D46CED